MKRHAIIIAGSIILILILIFTDFGKESKVYDCSIAEWHPDIPIRVREECRKLRIEQEYINRQRNLI